MRRRTVIESETQTFLSCPPNSLDILAISGAIKTISA